MPFTPSEIAQTERQSIRTQIRQARRALTAEQQSTYATQAAKLMLTQPKILEAKHLALYLSNDGELDTAPLIQALWALGIKLYLPRLHPFSQGNLIFMAYTPETEMLKNSYGIAEPKLDIRGLIPSEKLDVIITPLVAFDTQGNRMGMGGGYYDRTLASHRSQDKPYPVGYAHDCQQLDSLPCEHWDVPLPLLITPTQVLKFNI
ncbi:5-formyltetrahydrofolate cyclo-ligase [Shewanella violacea]|uniref:5-formyltetrahydrofolate cyclo-ligase n=1 Tax=Shewanella violacea (strain JCM 10179 / CIP 106290 / LMG 19151 / DSS12) TaxID=637905 RepID=D4ZBW3_SHEVD|nr:5-formyltetrahydrofolate cyclo-ligase [Shewanella violacea]BAJ03508.1 5-formyltetrahydrofolate cyclo-ligase family protein [Shewanella violacea DSS12]